MPNHTKLHQLQNILRMLYWAYEEGTLSESEYVESVKSIDSAIGKLEMAILQDTLAWKVSSLPHIQKPKC